MKKNLEQIDNAMFRALDDNEELGAVGGATRQTTTKITHFRPPIADILLDFRLDPV